MSVFTSLIIILLAMVIQGFLELGPGLFAIFYHHALGKTSAKKADDRSLSFILGVEICSAVTFLLIYIITSFFATEKDFFNSTFLWIMAGIFLAEALVSFFCYYRVPKSTKKSVKKNSTALFLPRHLAANLIHHAENAKNRSDTIIVGIITHAMEFIFTLPLYIICSYEILHISMRSSFIFIIAYVVIATIPLFSVRMFFRTGHHLADIQRLRVKKKPLTRLVISICYALLAIVTFITGIS